MTGLKRIGCTLPKTGTTIIKFVNGEKLMSKVIIPGQGNTNPYKIKSIITNYENQKPAKIMKNFESVMDAGLYFETLKASQYHWKLAK